MRIYSTHEPHVQYKQLINLVRPPKKSTFKIHDNNGIKLLTRLRVLSLVTYVATVSGTILTVQAHCVCVRLESRITNITSYTASDLHISVKSCLTLSAE